ncbi:hypothetical protein DEU56DRAFT_749217, partial [Suillus clintonianus]
GELEHRRVKRFYPRVSKSRFTSGIAKQQQRERILFRMAERIPVDKSRKRKSMALGSREVMKADAANMPSLRFEDSEQLPYTDPRAHYHISSGVRHYLRLSQWLGKNESDPAFVGFLPRLKDHILARLLKHNYDGDESPFSSAERSRLTFINDRIYRHKVI